MDAFHKIAIQESGSRASEKKMILSRAVAMSVFHIVSTQHSQYMPMRYSDQSRACMSRNCLDHESCRTAHMKRLT